MQSCSFWAIKKKFQPFLSHHTLWGLTLHKSTEFNRLLLKISVTVIIQKILWNFNPIFQRLVPIKQPLLEWFYKVLILGCFLPRLTDICQVDVEKMNILAFKSYTKTGIKHWPKKLTCNLSSCVKRPTKTHHITIGNVLLKNSIKQINNFWQMSSTKPFML